MSEELVSVQIDGEWHQFPKGTRMIEACRLAGKEVPHYCYHPKLSSPGNCRMCLVEMGMPPRPRPGEDLQPGADGHLPIQWMPRPAIACANTVAPNMGIRTDSDLTRACRHGVMELLLINHPLDCPICDQAGECQLQEFSVEHGTGESRFREQKVKKPKNVEIGPRIRLDDERCIMCSRCIRFTDEIADDPVLGFTDRGSHTALSVHPGQQLANNYSLNTVDICPVGALTSSDFRFQMRVWFLRETESICTSCGRGCNVTIGSREDKVYRLTPRENNEVNSAWMCDRGRLDFHWLDSGLRLTEPMARAGQGHRAVTWSEAIAVAGEALGRCGAHEVAVIASGRMTNEDLFMARKLAAALKTELVDIVPRPGEADAYLVAADQNPNTTGAKLILGLEEPGQALEEIRQGIAQGRIRALVAWEDNLFEGAGFTAAELGKLDFFLVACPLANPAAEFADMILPTAAFAEKRGSMVNLTGRLQVLNQAVAAPGQSREAWEIARDLIQALGGGNGIYSVDEVFSHLAAEVKEFEGLSLSRAGRAGLPLVETGETIPLLERERERVAQGIIVG